MLSLGGIVLVPLIASSLVAIALILERVIFWLNIQQKQNRIIGEFLYLYQNNPQAALPKLKENSNLPIARIFLAALELQYPTPEELKLALETAAQAEIPMLKRFNTVFETIIGIAPLLGLLGTILGLIETFSALKIGDIAATNTSGVSSGISDALITTAVGLLVAIITLLFANLFRSLYRRQLGAIQKYGGRFELLYRRKFREKSF